MEERKQEEIKFKDIMDLGFKEEFVHDQVFYEQYGFVYSIVKIQLTDVIQIYWSKTDRTCQLTRIDNPEDGNVKRRANLKNLDEVKDLINFFIDK